MTASQPIPQDTPKPRARALSSAHVYLVESRSQPGTGHMVNAQTAHCTCLAGKHNRACWHLSVARQMDAFRHQFA
jgi:hypothetical protein